MNKQERGARAKALIENPLLQEFWEEEKAGLVKLIEKVPLNDTAAIFQLTVSLQAIDAMERKFKRYVQSAEIELKEKERKKEQEKNQ